jgi:transposase
LIETLIGFVESIYPIKQEFRMKKRNLTINKNRLGSNSRRRQLLKRVHQKVISRRQNFQIIEATEELSQAC